MKKQYKVLSALLAILLCFSSASVGVYATYSYYDSPLGFDSIGKPYISIYQCGTMICDKIDEALAKQTKLKGEIDPIVYSKIKYDFTSINGAVKSLYDIGTSHIWSDAKKILGDLGDINVSTLKNCPKRTVPISKGGTYAENYNSGHYDIEILYVLCDFLFSNRELLQKIVNGTLDMGWLDSNLLTSLISALEDIVNTVKGLPIMAKQKIFEALFDEDEYPSALTPPDPEKKVTGSTMEQMINYFVYNLIFDGIKYGKYQYSQVKEGKDYTVGATISSTKYAFKVDIPKHGQESVTSVAVYFEKDASTGKYVQTSDTTFKSGKTYYKYARKDNNPELPALWDYVAQWAVDNGKVSSKANFGASTFKLEQMSAYDLIKIGINFAIDYFLINESGEAGDFSLYDTLVDVKPEYLSMVYGFLNFDTSAYSTHEETVQAFTNSLVDLENGCLSNYIRLTENGITLGSDFYTLLSTLLDFVASNMDMLKIYRNVGVYNEEELAAYKAAYPSDASTVAYLLRIILSGFVKWANIPATYEFNGQTRTVSTIPEVVTFLLIDLASDVLPQYDYRGMITRGEIDPRVIDYLHSSVDSAFCYVAAGLITFYLNTVTNMAIPEGYTFPQVLNHIADWAIANYGGVLNTTAIDSSYNAWQKLDWLLFGVKKDGTNVASAGILKLNWLKDVEGTYDLIMNHILCLANWDFDSFFSIFSVNSTGELAGNLRNLILNVAKRLFNGLFGGNVIIPNAVTTLEGIFGSTNMGTIVYNLCTYLKTYDDKIVASVLPLVVGMIVDNGVTNYSVHLAEGSAYGSYADLKAEYEADTAPDNKGLTVYDENYQFFGSDDFFPPYKYYLYYKDARNEAKKVLSKYKTLAAEDPATYSNYDIADARYRLHYYYENLTLRSTFDTTQLELDMDRANSLYGHAKNNSTYSLRTWNDYIAAYNFCEHVYETAVFNLSNTLRQSMITKARLNLKIAVKSLKKYMPLADYSALNNLIILATDKLASPAVLNGEYMESSVQNLRTAVYAANLVVAENYDQDDQATVDATYAALADAMNLVYIPAIAKVEGSNTNIDKDTKFISGFTPGFTSYVPYIDVHGAGSMNEYTNSNGGIGTGAKVELVIGTGEDAQVVDSYTILVYGDLDGDARADAADANLLNFYVNHYLSFSTATPEKSAIGFAADVNNDGAVDMNDVYFLIRAGLMDSNYVIDQRGSVA